MKELIIDDFVLHYKVDNLPGYYTETKFYLGITVITKKKYLFFGPTVTITEPEFVFGVPYDIEDPELTKDDVRNIIEKKITVLKRKAEIDRGEII